MEKISEIYKQGYKPSFQDSLLCKQRTAGICEQRLIIDNKEIVYILIYFICLF